MIFQIAYVSAAADSMSKDDLVGLLEQSRDKNESLGITGMLLYRDERFLQVLEGDKEDVRSLYETICADERHRGVVQVMGQSAEERDFPDWSMAFKGAASENEGGDALEIEQINTRGFTPFMEVTPDHFVDNLTFAHQLLLDFRDAESRADKAEARADAAEQRADDAETRAEAAEERARAVEGRDHSA